MTIVRTAYRYKRPPRKRQAAALEVPAVVKVPSKPGTRPTPMPEPGNDDGKPTPPPAAARKSAIVQTISRKQERFRRMAAAVDEDNAQESDEATTARFRTLIADKLRRPPAKRS
jgi:hypothetical protein